MKWRFRRVDADDEFVETCLDPSRRSAEIAKLSIWRRGAIWLALATLAALVLESILLEPRLSTSFGGLLFLVVMVDASRRCDVAIKMHKLAARLDQTEHD